jgi:DNA repair protein RecN (Recombination protein N)
MLLEIAIRNFAVIESARVAFGQGFHVLTGETGAGKSMIVDALGLIAGGRGSAEWVRSGADKAEIECLFDIPDTHPVLAVLREFGIDAPPGEMLVVRREITAQGKSVCRVNGQMVNLTMLKQIGGWLINIHGQHEHQSLLNPARHLDVLDACGGEALQELKDAYAEIYARYRAGLRQLHELEANRKDRLHKLDLYQFQAEEIAAAGLKEGEEEALTEERRRIANAERLMIGAAEAHEALYGRMKALELIGRALHRVEEMARYDGEALQPLVRQMQEAYYQLEDAAYQLRDYKERVEFNPVRLDQIEQRLDVINGLRRKYGDTIADILAYEANIRRELDVLQYADERVEELKFQVARDREQLWEKGRELSKARAALAEKLSAGIMEQLKDLHMEKTAFRIEMRPVEEPQASGLDDVEFLVSPNPGEPLRPLHKIASGGELSRIMLAIKGILAEAERIPVLVFDEVDTGVSGRTAQAIAEKMVRLSDACQVFAVTHLPQVACMADRHYLIEKDVAGERTFTHVRELDEPERVEALARMLGGVEVTSRTAEHAREMLRMAGEQKALWRRGRAQQAQQLL